jgi:hypothetical protein
MLTSQYFPAWYLGVFPDRRIILASYEADFAASWGRKARDILEEYGPSLFGVGVRRGSSAANRWDLEGKTGGMETAGIGGPITGKGANLLIIDDPVKNPAEALSPLYRQKAWDWYASAAYTRLEPDAAIVVIQTRWHPEDLAGRIVAQASKGGEPFEILNLPALAEQGDILGRQPGEALWPERFPAERLAEIRQTQGERWFVSLYQQRPEFAQVEGLVYPELAGCIIDPRPIRQTRAFAGVDFGYHCPAAIVVGVVDHDDVMYLVDEWYASRKTDEELIAHAQVFAQKWHIELFFCDSESPQSIAKMVRANLPARKAMKEVAEGIRSVEQRIRTGRLRVFSNCVHLIYEATQYRYPTVEERRFAGELPIKEHDHLMDATRYLIFNSDRMRGIYLRYSAPEPPQPQVVAESDADYLTPVLQFRYGKLPVRQEENRERPAWLEDTPHWVPWP